MELSQQVVSLELAKRLKELNVKQDSIFDWVLNNHKPDYYLWLMSPYNRENIKFKDQYSAFTVAELGEMLPSSRGNSYRDESGWYMNMILPVSEWKKYYPCVTEANARAKMLIHLLENKLHEV